MMRRFVVGVVWMCVLASCKPTADKVAPAAAPAAPAAPKLFESEEALNAALVDAAWRGEPHVERLIAASFSADQLKALCPELVVEGLVSPALARRVYAGLCGEALRGEAASRYNHTEELGGWCAMAPELHSARRELAAPCPGVQRFTLHVGARRCEQFNPCPEQPERCEDYECGEGEECDEACEPCSETTDELYSVTSLEVLKVEGGWGVLFVDEAMSEDALRELLAATVREELAIPWCRLAHYWDVEDE